MQNIALGLDADAAAGDVTAVTAASPALHDGNAKVAKPHVSRRKKKYATADHASSVGADHASPTPLEGSAGHTVSQTVSVLPDGIAPPSLFDGIAEGQYVALKDILQCVRYSPALFDGNAEFAILRSELAAARLAQQQLFDGSQNSSTLVSIAEAAKPQRDPSEALRYNDAEEAQLQLEGLHDELSTSRHAHQRLFDENAELRNRLALQNERHMDGIAEVAKLQHDLHEAFQFKGSKEVLHDELSASRASHQRLFDENAELRSQLALRNKCHMDGIAEVAKLKHDLHEALQRKHNDEVFHDELSASRASCQRLFDEIAELRTQLALKDKSHMDRIAEVAQLQHDLQEALQRNNDTEVFHDELSTLRDSHQRLFDGHAELQQRFAFKDKSHMDEIAEVAKLQHDLQKALQDNAKYQQTLNDENAEVAAWSTRAAHLGTANKLLLDKLRIHKQHEAATCQAFANIKDTLIREASLESEACTFVRNEFLESESKLAKIRDSL